jgi:hypothetical protein
LLARTVTANAVPLSQARIQAVQRCFFARNSKSVALTVAKCMTSTFIRAICVVTDTLDADLEATAKYGAVKVKASADYQKTLEKSKITLLTIGGNAEVNARPVDTTQIEDLRVAIQDKNALYSKSNPRQPIA